MREQPKKKQSKKNTNKKSYKPSKIDEEFFDLGIEPPKIYRESQSRITQAQQKRSRQSEDYYGMTRVERRQKETKRREKKNKFRKALSWIGAVLIIVALGATLCLTVFFQINNITTTGSKIYSKDKIISQCIIQKGKNLFTVDTDTAAQRIEENLPYAYKAQIKRKLPDTIEIKITDAKPTYSLLCEDNTYILLDDNFKVLEKGAQMATGIVINKTDIKSADSGHKIEFKNSDVGTCLERLGKSIKNNNFTEITSIYSNNISDNYVVYDNRITFKLGNSKDLDDKIMKGLAACDKLNESNPNATGTMTISTDKSIYFTEE